MTNGADPLRLLKYYTLSGFFVIGVVTVLLGQVLPILSVRLELNNAQAGILLLAQFTGALSGTVVVGWLKRRFGFSTVGLIGLVLMIVGVPGLNARDFLVCWVAIFVYGVGIGLAIPAINLLTIEVTPPDRQSSAVNLLNFAWGVGAICSRPFVEAVSADNSLIVVTAILTLALIAVAISFLAVLGKTDRQASRAAASDPALHIWRQPAAWLFLLFAFCAIGVEGGISGWLTTYSESLRAAGGPQLSATVVYFMFFVLGRAIASVVSRYTSENILITACSLILVTGIVLIVISGPLVLVGAAVAGLGSSAIFPTNMVRFTKIFGPGATRQATPIFISGTCGAASVSSLVGFVSHWSGSLRYGLFVILLSATAVAVLQVIIMMTFQRAPVVGSDTAD